MGPVPAQPPPPRGRPGHQLGRLPRGPAGRLQAPDGRCSTCPPPDELLERAATARAEHPSTGTIATVAQNWRRYAAWLTAGGITSLAQVDRACHEQYAAHIARLPLNARTQAAALSAVSVLWGFAPHLPAGDRIPMPPWEAEGLRHYLPAAQGSNENATAPVHPAVMSPLLVWALRFSEDFAGDILAALAEHQRLRTQIAPRTSPAAGGRLRGLLDEHARTGSTGLVPDPAVEAFAEPAAAGAPEQPPVCGVTERPAGASAGGGQAAGGSGPS